MTRLQCHAVLLFVAQVTLPVHSLAGQTAASLTPRRHVSGHTITSSTAPTLEITVDKSLSYAGGQRFTLYNVADAEQHFFVQADHGRVKRLIWIQFEEYLPSSNGRYGYETSRVLPLWGREMRVDGFLAHTPAPDSEPRKDSDGARMRAFLRAKGLTFGKEVLQQRLVWITDETRRREVMVMYAEELDIPGTTMADLETGGSQHAKWAELTEAMLGRVARLMAWK